MLGWLRSLRKTVGRFEWPPGRKNRGRLLDAAVTDRLNSRHWGKAKDESINSVLQAELSTLRARAQFEMLNNANVEGVVATHADDVVGADGPTLQVKSGDEKYDRAMEKIWRDWWSAPDVTGQLSGPELLSQAVRSLWPNGEFLFQITNDDEAAGPVQTRLKTIHPRRLDTPINLLADENVFMGVRRQRTGKPTQYYIDTTPETESLRDLSLNLKPIDAAYIIHGFCAIEPDQVRGLPWLSSCLQVIADLRDYDDQVMDAARMAADMAVLLYTKHPDARYIEVNETTEIERRLMQTLPPGWEAQQITPSQPPNTYRDFRSERLRELGRPVGMPLMMVQLDSRHHSYSSARFDSQVYQRSVRKLQRWLVRCVLNRLLDLVAREAELAGATPRPPGDVRYEWAFPPFPHVDPKKENDAVTGRLANETSCLRDECAALNKDWEDVLAQRGRERERKEELGLPTETPKPTGRRAGPHDPGGGNGRGLNPDDRIVGDAEKRPPAVARTFA